MRIIVRQLKRIIKEAVEEAVSAEKRATYNQSRREKSASERQKKEQDRVSGLNMPEDKEKEIANFVEDLHYEFGHTFGSEGGEMSWDEVMDFAHKKGVRTTPDEIERVMAHSHMVDHSLGYIMRAKNSGIFFDDPMAL